ncbi:biotin-dependent carboxyltransferase family protein [Oleiagrimonas sp. C23AA]|uniref:5-oxoprolinase subunit C family protein n=1 Tax=Oleiagrimonas sp. C23AA TaxID=2719047 RepID=UPI0014234C17|nr:biotin-dependent carboxyltransferase family protein [Oleiagrimonas sp. C23AA]NII10956.1 biotin-dependent carboxyltransferase family protein [Oleiagrimonas sp. C23AA]
MIKVIKPGLLTSLQDMGREGYAHLGIGAAGAADAPCARLANTLVGNRPEACVLELSLQGPQLQLQRDAWVALCGAPMPQARHDKQPLPMWRPVRVRAGASLDLGGMAAGCRAYLAVDGGIDVPPLLGSRSTDLNARLGPLEQAIKAGDELPLGPPVELHPDTESLEWSLDPSPWFDASQPVVLRVLAGSHTTMLDDASRRALTEATFQVGTDSNRVGVRLLDVPLMLREPVEMLSEASVPGVIQLPPGGEPIVLMTEHPVTGGYPRIGKVADVDLPRLAQCRPGHRVRLTWIHPDAAFSALHEQRRMLGKLEGDIARRLTGEA